MWSLAGSQVFDQPICWFGPGSGAAGLSTSLDLVRVGSAIPAALGHSRATGPSATLGLCMGQLASAAGVHPPTRGFRCGRPAGVSGVGGQLGFQLWAPSQLIWVHPTLLQVRAWAAYPVFTVQGLRGEGRQRPWLLGRVL